jgi:uncharacterized protein (TIGR02001 family)
MQKYFLALAFVAAPLSPAAAQDFFVYGGVELTYDIERDGAGTDNVAALYSYIEVEKAGFYAGLSGEVSSLDIENEVDVYLGYRAETDGGFSYDVGYTRYIYPNDGGDCCGELTLALGVPLGDKFNATFDAAYDPEASLGNAYVGLEYYATDALTLSANYGTYEVDGAGSEEEWDVGVGYAVTEEAAVDLRYYDGTEYVDSYVGLSITWDTTIFSR